eukprot:TRINITY_DN9736_c0_g1_i15.p1 TRINITY_DN9736_c0_g1~~TRINITY_DN9736_c0_g1_i15.p1  ORF type:complete len:203 (-),score=5.41 TRINITY_DN9736_c0_g1_i15:764-1372(-)
MPALTEFVRGLLYAINLPATFIYLYRSETIVNRCLKCVALNGVIFLGSIFLVQYVLLPTVHAVLHYDVDAGPQTNSVLLLTYNFIGVCFDVHSPPPPPRTKCDVDALDFTRIHRELPHERLLVPRYCRVLVSRQAQCKHQTTGQDEVEPAGCTWMTCSAQCCPGAGRGDLPCGAGRRTCFPAQTHVQLCAATLCGACLLCHR